MLLPLNGVQGFLNGQFLSHFNFLSTAAEDRRPETGDRRLENPSGSSTEVKSAECVDGAVNFHPDQQ